jgi:hypothetical protein
MFINVTGMAMSGYIKEHLGYMGNFSLGIGSALLAMFYAAIFLKVSSIITTSTQLSSLRLVADLQLVLCRNFAQG